MSVDVSISVEGIEEFKTAIESLDSKMREHLHRQLATWAADIQALAKQLVPVRTGHLRGSIYSKAHDWIAEIGAEASYACWVEFGTRHVRARPYLYPAIQQNLPRLEQIVCNAIDAARAEAGL